MMFSRRLFLSGLSFSSIGLAADASANSNIRNSHEKGELTAYDSFTGTADRILRDGSTTKSNHSYELVGRARQYVEDGFYRSKAVRSASICYVNLEQEVKTISAEFAFFEQGVARERSENAVIGVCKERMPDGTRGGFGRGSIQLACDRNGWLLFFVRDNPWGGDTKLDDPYPIVASGEFFDIAPVPSQHNYCKNKMGKQVRLIPDSKVLSYEMQRIDKDKIAVFAPTGVVSIVTLPESIMKFWGNRIGIQQRRPRGDDGHIGFKKWEVYT